MEIDNDVIDTAGAEVAQESDDQPQEQAQEQEQELTEEQALDAVLEEIEFDGKKYMLPKEIKDSLLMRADYSRKTAEVAAEREAVQAQAHIVRESRQMQEATKEIDVQEAIVSHALEQYRSMDWDALARSNPAAMSLELAKYQRLKDTQQSLAEQRAHISNLFKERVLDKHRQVISKGLEELRRDIPGFDQKLAAELVAYGVNTLGMDQSTLESITDPRQIKLLHKAWQYDKAQAQNAPAKQTPNTPRVIKGQAVTATKDPDKLPPGEWMKWREKNLRKRGRI